MLDVSRKENKYVIGKTEVPALAAKLQHVIKKDSHSGKDGYMVRSLYFDTLLDKDFEQKVNGYNSRKKIRLRVYSHADKHPKLEVKEKTGSAQRKRSLILNRSEAEQMIQGNYSFLLNRPEDLAKQIYAEMMTKCYKPKCVVEYDRLAFMHPDNEIRITFDQNLRASEGNLNILDPNLVCYPVTPPNEVTMEVKYSGYLYTFIKDILNNSERTLCSNSKYCRCRMISKHGQY